jgi:elongation factor Ts
MSISAQDVLKLRQITGSGMMECKKALTEANGDFDKAIEILRKQGAKTAAKKADRDSKEGIVSCYIHSNEKVGAMIKLACETDFVARNEEFKKLAYDIAMHITATAPKYIKPEDVSEEDIEQEKEIYRAQLKEEGKPDEMIEKILSGKINKYFEEVCLLKQSFVKDPDTTIEGLIQEAVLKIGENIQIVEFVRFEI